MAVTVPGPVDVGQGPQVGTSPGPLGELVPPAGANTPPTWERPAGLGESQRGADRGRRRPRRGPTRTSFPLAVCSNPDSAGTEDVRPVAHRRSDSSPRGVAWARRGRASQREHANGGLQRAQVACIEPGKGTHGINHLSSPRGARSREVARSAGKARRRNPRHRLRLARLARLSLRMAGHRRGQLSSSTSPGGPPTRGRSATATRARPGWPTGPRHPWPAPAPAPAAEPAPGSAVHRSGPGMNVT